MSTVLFGSVLIAVLLFTCMSPTAQASDAELHLLTVNVCPPYRKEIPVDLCRNSAKKITESFRANLNISSENIYSLVDESATGANFLTEASKLKGAVGANDRVIVYLQLHGDAFHLWADYYRPDRTIASVENSFVRPDEDILVFWTEREPSVPALAIAEKDWLTASEVTEALDAINANVSIILDSCSSSLFFGGLSKSAFDTDNIDYVLTSAGAEQVSNFDDELTVSLFARELSDSLELPTVRTFGEAVEHARITTVLGATAHCSKTIIKPEYFRLIFPHLNLPSEQTSSGKVAPPLWFCAQVPSVVDLSGETSALGLR